MEGAVSQEIEFTVAKENGLELKRLPEIAEVDIDIGNKDDFEIIIPNTEWSEECYSYGCRIFVADTEYGGEIQDIESTTETEEVTIRGSTWRGRLKYKIVEPPAGKDYLTVSGDLNEILKELIGDCFGGLFEVSEKATGINVENWKVDRYVALYDAIMKILDRYQYRLDIRYIQPEGQEFGYVLLQAVPIIDYSEDLEYSNEEKINVNVRDCRSGINHLVCVGEGENQERIVIHLYVQKDGSIGKVPHYTGKDELAAVYNYSSADAEKLEEGGIKRLQELQNYKKCEMTIEDMNLQIGDIVSGYDTVTDTVVQKPVVQKILKMKNGEITIEHKMKGDD